MTHGKSVRRFLFGLAFAFGWTTAVYAADVFTLELVARYSGPSCHATYCDGPLAYAKVKTSDQVERFSDADGMVHYYERGLMSQPVRFDISKPGYESRSVALETTEGVRSEVIVLQNEEYPELDPFDVSTHLVNLDFVPAAEDFFEIEIFDLVGMRPVPMLGLRSPARAYWTDNAGRIAFLEPDAMGTPVEFGFTQNGYELLGGEHTVVLTPEPGVTETLFVERSMVAERMYRASGPGLFRDSERLGYEAPVPNASLNARVIGHDGGSQAAYENRLYWFWGDTRSPVGARYQGTGSVSRPAVLGGLGPSEGLAHEYFQSEGGARAIADIPGPTGRPATWITGPFTLRDPKTAEVRLFARWSHHLGLTPALRTGLAEWNAADEVMRAVYTTEADQPERKLPIREGSPHQLFLPNHDWMYFGPYRRVAADLASITDPTAYEVYTPIPAGETEPVRAETGIAVWEWRLGGEPISMDMIGTDRILRPEESPYPVGEILFIDGKLRPAAIAFGPDGATIAGLGTAKPVWNEYRKRYVVVFVQLMGSPSLLGEIWFAEADTPIGPWAFAHKIATLDTSSQYFVHWIPQLAEEAGRLIYYQAIEPGFLSTLTPRYNYNQVIYRLDLARPELNLPVAVYDLVAGPVDQRFATREHFERDSGSAYRVPFFALSRATASSVRVYHVGARLQLNKPGRRSKPIFHGLSLDDPEAPPTTTPLYEYLHLERSGVAAYSTDPHWCEPEYSCTGTPLVRVWKSPTALAFPVTAYLDGAGDRDGDGLGDNRDNCVVIWNPDQWDSNVDGLGNACDGDLDNDGDVDARDGKILLKHLGTSNGDRRFDADADLDHDGVIDGIDSELLATLQQYPEAAQGLDCKSIVRGRRWAQKACFDHDGDMDLDGIANGSDNCLLEANSDQQDSDLDGIGDACDRKRAKSRSDRRSGRRRQKGL